MNIVQTYCFLIPHNYGENSCYANLCFLWALHTFSAKEKDTETGLSYFGSRYYSSDLSIWLSVDPMSDKYPSLSPYTYCANNPIKLVDPDGMKIGDVDEASQAKINALTNKNSADYSRAFTRQYRRLERSKQVYNFYEATENEITTSTQGKVMKNDNGSIDIYHSSVPSARTSLEGGFSKEYATLFEETFHAADYDRGRLDLNNSTCMDEARAWKFATKAPGTNMRWEHFDKNGKYSDYTFAYALKHSSILTIAKGFKEGFNGYIDADNNEHFFIKGKDGNGLYNHLKLRK